jgi:hypothetical protein
VQLYCLHRQATSQPVLQNRPDAETTCWKLNVVIAIQNDDTGWRKDSNYTVSGNPSKLFKFVSYYTLISYHAYFSISRSNFAQQIFNLTAVNPVTIKHTASNHSSNNPRRKLDLAISPAYFSGRLNRNINTIETKYIPDKCDIHRVKVAANRVDFKTYVREVGGTTRCTVLATGISTSCDHDTNENEPDHTAPSFNV